MTSTSTSTSGGAQAAQHPQPLSGSLQHLDHLVSLLSIASPGPSSPRNLSRASSMAHMHAAGMTPGASPTIVGAPRRGVHGGGAMAAIAVADQQGPAAAATVAETAQWLLTLDEEVDTHAGSVGQLPVISVAADAAGGGGWVASPISATPAGSGHLALVGGHASATRTATTASVASEAGYHADDEHACGSDLDDQGDDEIDLIADRGADDNGDGLSWLHETFASSLSTLLSATRAPTPHRRTPPRSNTPNTQLSGRPQSPLDLPELLLHIFHYLTLDPPSLLAAALACRTWSRLAVPLLYDHLELWSPYDLVHLAQTMSALRATSHPTLPGPRSLSFRRCESLTPALLLSLYPATHHPPRTQLQALDCYVCPDLSPSLIPTLFPLNSPSPSTLSTLRLAGCPRICDTDLKHISANCPLLGDLDLRACYLVTDAGVAHIARACPRLVSINVGRAVDGTLITDAAVVALARGCPRLALVGLAGTHVTDHGVRVLMARQSAGVRVVCLNMCPVVTPALVIWLGRRVGAGESGAGAAAAVAARVRITALDTIELRDCPHFASATSDVDHGTPRGRALWRGWCRLRRAGVSVSLPVTLLSAMHWYAVRLVDVQYAKDADRGPGYEDAGGAAAGGRRRMGSGRAVGPLWPLLGELLGESVVESSSVGASRTASHVWETASVVGMPAAGGWGANPALGV